MNRFLIASLLLLSCHLEASTKKNQAITQDKQPTLTRITTEAESKKALASGCTVIMFTADWCNYCKNMKPIFESLSKNTHQQPVTYAYVDLGKSFTDLSEITVKLQKELNLEITMIPAFLVFKNGKLVGKPILGSQTEEQLKKALSDEINRSSSNTSKS